MTGILGVRENQDLDHIPGEDGLPMIGHTLNTLRDPGAFLQGMYERYGPVFRLRNFFERRVVFAGPEAAELILMDREQNFSSRLGWDHFLGRFFHNGLMLRDFDDHRYHRRILQEPFKKPAMENYLADMGPTILRHIEPWPDQQPLRFYDSVKELTLGIASEVFLGLELSAASGRVIHDFRCLVDASVALVPVPVPGLAVWKGLRARRSLNEFFLARTARQRQSEGQDLFTRLCHAESEEGEQFSDQEIVDHIIFLLFAAHDTTTSALTTMAYFLARHPRWQDTLRAEMEAHGEGPLDYAMLHNMPKTEWVFKEALRLYPPVISIARRTLREFHFHDFRIPENTAINLDIVLSHHLPDCWSNPYTFDPERFSDERAEHKRHRFSWVPFGGGAHMCIGMHFAYMMVKAILHRVLTRYRLVVPEGYEMPYQSLPIPRPKDRLPMFVERL